MVRLAVCGAGNWGKNLVRNFAAVKNAELVAVCDLDPKVRQRVEHQHPGVRTTDDYESLLSDKDIDAIVIAVEAPHHFKLGKMALEAGKHLYVEKPLTLSSEESQTLVDLANAKDLRLMVGHLLVYHPAVEYIRGMIESGELDPLYMVFQRLNLGVVRRCENAWWSLAPHDIAIACRLFGAQPVRVSATGHDYLQPGIEDVVFAALTFPDGKMAHIHVSWLDPHKTRKATVVGKQKMVVFDDMAPGEMVRVYDKRADVKYSNGHGNGHGDNGGAISYAESVTLRSGDIHIPAMPAGEPLRIECQHFVDRVMDGKPALTDGLDGVRVVKTLEAGSQSLRQGGEPVELHLTETVNA